MNTQALGFMLGDAPQHRAKFERSRERVHSATHKLASSLIETWHNLKPRGGMVMGRHFPSRTFASLLPHILLLEPIHGARDFRFRVAGFGMFRFYGLDLKGRSLSDFFAGSEHEERCARLIGILHGDTPHISMERIHRGPELLTTREVVSLPVLASDGRTPLVLRASFWGNLRWLN